MISRPSKAGGIEAHWMPVGEVKLRLAHAVHSSGLTPSEAKVRGVVSSSSSTPTAGESCLTRDDDAAGEGDRDEDEEAADEPEADDASSSDMLTSRSLNEMVR